MFGLLKKLFSKGADAPPVAPPPPSPPPPAREPQRPAPVPATPAAPAPAARTAPAKPAGDSIEVNLRAVIARLPEELKSSVTRQPGGSATVPIALGTVLQQLPQGAVKISFGDLKSLAPGGIFSGATEQDQVLVDIPLVELLPQIKPEFLARRPNQKQVEVPADVTPLFGPRGQAIPQPKAEPEKPAQEKAAPAKPAPAPPPPAPVVAKPAPPPEPPPTPAPPPPPEPVAVAPEPAPVAPPEPDVPIKPSFSLPDPASLRPTQPTAAAKPPAPAPLKPPTPAAPKLPSASSSAPALPKPAAPLPKPPAPLPKPAPTPPPAPALPKPAPAPAPATAPAPVPAAGGPQVVSIPLATAGANWPEPLKQAVAAGNATIEIPFADADQAMKKGKVVFPWQRLREWIKPAAPAVEVADTLELEIPLAIVAPAFMALRLPARAQKQVSVAANIPDLFTGKPAAPASATPAPAPTPAPAAPAAPAAATSPLGVLFGQPTRTTWTPVDLVLKTAVLKGLSGALIATADGLLVAGLLPPGMKGETFAAFVPQIFNRTSQYTKEMNLGELSLVTLTVNQSSCQIHKAGGVFFAVLGKPGETLPADKLALVVAELARQNQK